MPELGQNFPYLSANFLYVESKVKRLEFVYIPTIAVLNNLLNGVTTVLLIREIMLFIPRESRWRECVSRNRHSLAKSVRKRITHRSNDGERISATY